jgi:hypothetical protein
VIEWREFRDRAIERGATGEGYYERWYETLERLLLEQGVVTPREIATRGDAIAHERAHDHHQVTRGF